MLGKWIVLIFIWFFFFRSVSLRCRICSVSRLSFVSALVKCRWVFNLIKEFHHEKESNWVRRGGVVPLFAAQRTRKSALDRPRLVIYSDHILTSEPEIQRKLRQKRWNPWRSLDAAVTDMFKSKMTLKQRKQINKKHIWSGKLCHVRCLKWDVFVGRRSVFYLPSSSLAISHCACILDRKCILHKRNADINYEALVARPVLNWIVTHVWSRPLTSGRRWKMKHHIPCVWWQTIVCAHVTAGRLVRPSCAILIPHTQCAANDLCWCLQCGRDKSAQNTNKKQ